MLWVSSDASCQCKEICLPVSSPSALLWVWWLSWSLWPCPLCPKQAEKWCQPCPLLWQELIMLELVPGLCLPALNCINGDTGRWCRVVLGHFYYSHLGHWECPQSQTYSSCILAVKPKLSQRNAPWLAVCLQPRCWRRESWNGCPLSDVMWCSQRPWAIVLAFGESWGSDRECSLLDCMGSIWWSSKLGLPRSLWQWHGHSGTGQSLGKAADCPELVPIACKSLAPAPGTCSLFWVLLGGTLRGGCKPILCMKIFRKR